MEQARFALLSATLALGLFLAILLAMEAGRRLGLQQIAARGEAAKAGAISGPVFAVFSLLMGFAFSGAAQRFDHRRELVVAEATAMAGAWKRIDLLGPELQPPVRARFRDYADALLVAYASAPGSEDEAHHRTRAARAQRELWSTAVAFCLTPAGEPARVLLLPSLTEMFHAVETEHLVREVHPPTLVYVMLAIAALTAALFAGYGIAGSAARSWIHMVGAAATISIVAYVIFELESPRLGLVRVDAMDRAIADVRATMD